MADNGRQTNGHDLGTRRNAIASLFGRRPSMRSIDTGEPLGVLLARAAGLPFDPPEIADLEALLGEDVYGHLEDVPETARAIRAWADAPSGSRDRETQALAAAIADELDTPKLRKRIAREIGRIK